jgi:hypothetical protein
MLVFAISDKGGTGRSVTSGNIVYRRALQGSDVVYLDFDFGSPTAGAIFTIEEVVRGTADGGLHSYLLGDIDDVRRLDVWSESERASLRGRPDGAGRLVLIPGDIGGGEFPVNPDVIRRCVKLLLRMEQEFDICVVDLSAGRSYAVEIVLAATACAQLRDATARWLVFHRWTRQHIIAAAGLVDGQRGIIELGVDRGHDRERLSKSIRYVRTAFVDPNADDFAGLRPEQIAWLRDTNRVLQKLASDHRIGRTTLIGSVPLDPVLQWREQLITDWDTTIRQIANRSTVDAFELIAKRLDDDDAWAGL